MVIIDMYMPTKCTDCILYNSCYNCCMIASLGVVNRYECDKFTKRPEWCPIIKECEDTEA